MVNELQRNYCNRDNIAEKPVVEKPPVVHHHNDRERDVTEDENSLYYIIRNSKSAIAVC